MNKILIAPNNKLKIKKILGSISLTPQKQLGQNFLSNEQTAQKIVNNFELEKADNILEIGPGLGIITQFLQGKTVIAVEKSQKLFLFLQNNFAYLNNIKFFHKDILDFDFNKIKNQPKYKVISNLPFSVATKILKLLLWKKNLFSHLYLSFAENVAEKILTLSGNKKNSSFSILVNFFAIPQKSITLEPFLFFPQPKTKVVFVTFKMKEKLAISEEKKIQEFLDFVKKCFFYKRKTIINNLRQRYNLNGSQVKLLSLFLIKNYGSSQIRAEFLGLNDFLSFFFFFLSDITGNDC